MTEAWILSFALILVRVATFWMVLPVWSAVQVPRMIKMGLVLSLTLFWFTALDQPTAPTLLWASGDVHWLFLVFVVAQELVLGGMLGLAFMVFLVPAQIAGAYIGQELGLSMATLTDSASGVANNIVATLFQVFAITFFFVLDLHHFLIYLLNASFELQPAGEPFQSQAIGNVMIGLANITEQGLVICMPIAVVSFVTLVALLLLARAAPALNLFSVGMPVRLLLGLSAILLFLPSILASLKSQFNAGVHLLQSLVY